MVQQHGPGRNPATARRTQRKWSHEENGAVMESFYKSSQKRIGYRKIKVNAVLGKSQGKDITNVNDLIFGGAALVTEMVGMHRK